MLLYLVSLSREHLASKVDLISNRLILCFLHLFDHTSSRKAEVRKTVAIAWDSDKLRNCRWRRSAADRSDTPLLRVVRSAWPVPSLYLQVSSACSKVSGQESVHRVQLGCVAWVIWRRRSLSLEGVSEEVWSWRRSFYCSDLSILLSMIFCTNFCNFWKTAISQSNVRQSKI